MNTTHLDGAACYHCGEDSVWLPTIAEGSHLVERPLCGACSDDQTFICVDCGVRSWNADAAKVYDTFNRCRPCADDKEDAFKRSWEQRQSEHKDDFQQTRR
jgi:hypothetical protein